MPEPQTTHHVTLAFGGTTYGLMVKNYVKTDISSFAPKIASGDLRYADQTINQTFVQDDFSHGFGYKDMTDPAGYAFTGDETYVDANTYSRSGVDTRYPHMLMLATAPVSASTMDTGLTISPVKKFIEYKDAVYACTSAGVYKWDGAEWDSTGQDTGTCLDALDEGDYLFVTMDGDRGRMFNGTTWADIGQASFTDMQFLCKAMGRLWASDDGIPWVHYTGGVTTEYPNTDWEGGRSDDGVGDPDGCVVGAGNIPIQGLVDFQNALYVAREDGLWYVAATQAGTVLKPVAFSAVSYASERHSYNFKSMVVWQGALYFTIKNQIWKMTANAVTNITPKVYGFAFPFQQYGHFRHLTPAGPFLYCIATESYGDAVTYGNETYGYGIYGGGGGAVEVLLCYDGVAWHKLWQLAAGADTITALNYTPVNDKLWYCIDKGTGTDEIYYIPLRTYSHLPEASYETTTAPPDLDDKPHYLHTSRFDAGLTTTYKYFDNLAIKGIKSTTSPVDVYYAIDGGGYQHLATFDDEALIEQHNFPAGTVGKTINFRLNLQTSSAGASPVIEALILHYLPRPGTIYSWTFDVVMPDKGQTLDHRNYELDPYDVYTVLQKARAQRSPMTFGDLWGNQYQVFATSVKWIPKSASFKEEGYPTNSATYAGNPRNIEGYCQVTLAMADENDQAWLDL
jgi:hypothetical protein